MQFSCLFVLSTKIVEEHLNIRYLTENLITVIVVMMSVEHLKLKDTCLYIIQPQGLRDFVKIVIIGDFVKILFNISLFFILAEVS